MEKQKTIFSQISLSGIGIHTGNKVNVTFKPALESSGVTFIRTDISGNPRIRADVGSYLAAKFSRRSSIGSDNAEVQTIEHLMAVLSSLGVDNIDVELNNNELPGLDGSAIKFVEALEKAGIVTQEQEKYIHVIKEAISIEDGQSSITVVPSKEFKISYTLD
jgi:UDP-3-O-[3-hydroxymyristoyl] N-acetylglucosamine deacetylase/3-hydroxyacyl-[acyl-carrier-protein] dehydratase